MGAKNMKKNLVLIVSKKNKQHQARKRGHKNNFYEVNLTQMNFNTIYKSFF